MSSANFLHLKKIIKEYKKTYLAFDFIYVNIASQFNIQGWATKVQNEVNPYYLEIIEKYFDNIKKKVINQNIINNSNKKELKLKNLKNSNIIEKEDVCVLKKLANISLLLSGKYKSFYKLKKKSLFSLKLEYLLLDQIKAKQNRLKMKLSLVGEISEPDFIDPNTTLPYTEGLFCQKIFGPIKSNICECQKYINNFYKKSCNICSVELGDPRVRRYRLGVTNLHIPLIHSWFLDYLHLIIKDQQNYVFLTKNFLKKLIFFQKHILAFLDEVYFKVCFLKITKIKQKSLNYDYICIKQKAHDLKILNNSIFLNKTYIKKYTLEKKKSFLDPEFWHFNYLSKNIAKKKVLDTLQRNFFLKKNCNNLFYKQSQRAFISNNMFGINIFASLLENLEIDKEIEKCRSLIYNLKENSLKNSFFITKKIRVLESFLFSKNNIRSLIVNSISILPPAYRPIFQVSKQEKFAEEKNTTNQLLCSHLNTIYGDIIRLNTFFIDKVSKNFKFKLLKLKEIKQMQQLVDFLIDGSNKRAGLFKLEQNKSLTEFLITKDGFFRANVLGKRVNYSARSVITPGPSLKFNQCGMPFSILKKLFDFHINKIFNFFTSKKVNNLNFAFATNKKLRKRLYYIYNYAIQKKKNLYIYNKISSNKNITILRKDLSFFFFLKNLVKNYSILLNRAPTLHKYGIQAFNIKPILSSSVQLHPLLCTAFNADFDGDQMGIHLPLYNLTQLEIKSRLKPSGNFFSLRNGNSLIKPTQDMIIGYYYLTYSKNKVFFLSNKICNSNNIAFALYFQKKIFLNDIILLKNKKICQFFHIINGNIYFFDKNFSVKNKNIKIYKAYKSKKKSFLLTEVGILVMNKINHKVYKLSDCFYQTTIGRLILNNFLKNVYKSNGFKS